MCINCKERLKNYNLRTVTVIEAHRAEIQEMFDRLLKETEDETPGPMPPTEDARTKSALQIALFAISYLLYSRGDMTNQENASISVLVGTGIDLGLLVAGAREYDEKQKNNR